MAGLTDSVAANIPSVTVGTTRVRLSQTATLALSRWGMVADLANPGTIYVGGDEVALDGSQGVPLPATASLDGYTARPYYTWAIATAPGCVLHFWGHP